MNEETPENVKNVFGFVFLSKDIIWFMLVKDWSEMTNGKVSATCQTDNPTTN